MALSSRNIQSRLSGSISNDYFHFEDETCDIICLKSVSEPIIKTTRNHSTVKSDNSGYAIESSSSSSSSTKDSRGSDYVIRFFDYDNAGNEKVRSQKISSASHPQTHIHSERCTIIFKYDSNGTRERKIYQCNQDEYNTDVTRSRYRNEPEMFGKRVSMARIKTLSRINDRPSKLVKSDSCLCPRSRPAAGVNLKKPALEHSSKKRRTSKFGTFGNFIRNKSPLSSRGFSRSLLHISSTVFPQKSSQSMNESPVFIKYIPVDNYQSASISRLHKIHSSYKQEWLDAQVAYVTEKSNRKRREKEYKHKTRISSSSTLFKKMSCKRNQHPRKTISDVDVAEKPNFRSNFQINASPNFGLDVLNSDPRFSLDINEIYIQLVTNQIEDTQLSAVLYAQFPEEPNYGLLHQQTELAVGAMITFFPPSTNVHALWIRDLQNEIERLEADPDASLVRWQERSRQCHAVLILSQDACVLLRHSKTYFVYSLSLSLNVTPQEMYVYMKK